MTYGHEGQDQRGTIYGGLYSFLRGKAAWSDADQHMASRGSGLGPECCKVGCSFLQGRVRLPRTMQSGTRLLQFGAGLEPTWSTAKWCTASSRSRQAQSTKTWYMDSCGSGQGPECCKVVPAASHRVRQGSLQLCGAAQGFPSVWPAGPRALQSGLQLPVGWGRGWPGATF